MWNVLSQECDKPIKLFWVSIGVTREEQQVKVHYLHYDIPTHNQFIQSENLMSQVWLNKIEEWTDRQKGMINAKKTKTMIFNFTNNHQFTTRLSLGQENLEVIKSVKLLGTIITDDLKWDENTANLVKKGNARLELLRKISSFGTNLQDLKEIYILFVRSIVEQSAVVWHSSLTLENANDLERIQKSALKIILGQNYISYPNALKVLDLEKLSDRREKLCLNFAIKAAKHESCKGMFPLNTEHKINTRYREKYKVKHSNTDRMKTSALVYMQTLLNKNEIEKNENMKA